MCKKMPFSYTNFQKSPYRPLPHSLPIRSLRSLTLASPLTNPDCTTVTGIAKGHRGPCPAPLLTGVEEIFKGGSRGLVYATSHNLPPNNAFKGEVQ